MKPLVAGNWKMHKDRASAKALATELLRSLPDPLEGADVALFPPFTALQEVAGAIAGGDITVGAQNFYPADEGAFTGEISLPMLLDVGVTWALAGHSERRHLLGESDELVNRKVLAALAHDVLPILCVGELREEREAGRTEEVVERQIRAGLAGVAAEHAKEVTIAYEPVWAIGTGLTATVEQAGAVHAFIRRLLGEVFGQGGSRIRILYGGSVKPDNAAELLGTPEINGALVGGASLGADSFVRIVKAANP